MNISQAHKEFQLFLDKVDSQALPDFLPHEIDTFLHEAEIRRVREYYALPHSQDRSDSISSLIRTTVIPFSTNEAILPTDYMHLDRLMVKVKSDKVVGTYTTPYLCPSDKLNVVLQDPFNKSTIAYPIVWQESNKLYIDTPDFQAIDAKLTYLKYPVRVSKKDGVSSELTEKMQRETIQLAVRIALGSISGDYGVQSNEVNTL